MSGSNTGHNFVDGSGGREGVTIAGSLHLCLPITVGTSEWHTAGKGAGLRRDSAQGKPDHQVSHTHTYKHNVKSLDDRHQGLLGERRTLSCLHNT